MRRADRRSLRRSIERELRFRAPGTRVLSATSARRNYPEAFAIAIESLCLDSHMASQAIYYTVPDGLGVIVVD